MCLAQLWDGRRNNKKYDNAKLDPDYITIEHILHHIWVWVDYVAAYQQYRIMPFSPKTWIESVYKIRCNLILVYVALIKFTLCLFVLAQTILGTTIFFVFQTIDSIKDFSSLRLASLVMKDSSFCFLWKCSTCNCKYVNLSWFIKIQIKPFQSRIRNINKFYFHPNQE